MATQQLNDLPCPQCSKKYDIWERRKRYVFVLKPQLPRYTGIYDPSIIMKLPENAHLMMEMLVKKMATLLMLLSGQRGQNMPMLQLDCMFKTDEAYTFFIPEAHRQNEVIIKNLFVLKDLVNNALHQIVYSGCRCRCDCLYESLIEKSIHQESQQLRTINKRYSKCSWMKMG